MDIPGDFSSPAVLPFSSAYVSGVFENGADEDWYRVQLEKGDAIALMFDCSVPCQASLVDPNGGIVASASGFDTGVLDGTGFVAPLDGTYFWSVKNNESEPGTYRTRLMQDCADRPPTICKLELSNARIGDFFFIGDGDAWSVTLSADRVYDVTLQTLSVDQSDLRISISTRWGGYLVGVSEPPIGGSRTVLSGFRPPASGAFLIGVGPGSTGRYRLLVRPR